MKAITVEPKSPGSARLEDIPEPDPSNGSVLVEAIAVGVCGTDTEIVEGKYGWAPPGKKRLVLGHESLGRVIDPGASSSLKQGDLIVGIVRRPDGVPCPNCAVGEWDMCTNGQYTERGIKEIDGFMSERWRIEPEYAMKVDRSLGILGVLLEPTTVVAKAWEQVGAVGNRAFWEPNKVLVTGAGPIGLLAALAVPADPTEPGAWLVDPVFQNGVRIALNLVPFAGIAFLWFMAVLRYRIGLLEDRFFATVFLGSGLLFVAMLFAAAAVSRGLLDTFAAGASHPTQSETYLVGRGTAYAMMNLFGMKMAAVFMFVTSMSGLRTAVLARWVSFVGFGCGLVLLLVITDFAWISLIFPLWAMLVSAYILFEDFRQGRPRAVVVAETDDDADVSANDPA